MKNIFRLFVLGLISLVITACGNNNDSDKNNDVGSNDDLTPVSFVLDWTPNTNHTGIYVAKEKGYFEDEGLDVEILLPGEAGANQLIASGSADFGVSYQESITQARAEDLPVVSITAVLQHNTAGYASPVDKDITEPIDFEGKKFGAYGSDLEYAMMKTIMEQNGADIDQVEFITTGDSDFFVAVKRDVDFSLVFQGWTGIEAELRDEPMNMVYLADFAEELDFYTPVLATSEALIEKDPDTVRAFVHAAVKGYEYAIENPADAAAILIDQEPDLDPDLVNRSQEWISQRYQDDAERFGIQEQSRWENFATFMLENGIIDEPLDIDKAFTNEFLPE